MDYILSLQNLYVEILNFSVTMPLEIGPLRRYLRLHEVIKVGPSSNRTGGLIKEEQETRDLSRFIQAQGSYMSRQREGSCL